LCDSEDCVHVNFAYSLPSVRELMEKYKWKIANIMES
jgi:hypothetical protein